MAKGMPWYRENTDWEADPAVQVLCETLKHPWAAIHVSRLRSYTARFYPDTAIAVTGLSLERSLGWKGKPGVLLAALLAPMPDGAPGILGGTDGAYVLTGWDEDNAAQYREVLRKRGQKPTGPMSGGYAENRAPSPRRKRAEPAPEARDQRAEAAPTVRNGTVQEKDQEGLDSRALPEEPPLPEPPGSDVAPARVPEAPRATLGAWPGCERSQDAPGVQAVLKSIWQRWHDVFDPKGLRGKDFAEHHGYTIAQVLRNSESLQGTESEEGGRVGALLEALDGLAADPYRMAPDNFGMRLLHVVLSDDNIAKGRAVALAKRAGIQTSPPRPVVAPARAAETPARTIESYVPIDDAGTPRDPASRRAMAAEAIGKVFPRKDVG